MMPDECPFFSIRYPFLLCIRTTARLFTVEHGAYFSHQSVKASVFVLSFVLDCLVRALGRVHADLDGSPHAL